MLGAKVGSPWSQKKKKSTALCCLGVWLINCCLPERLEDTDMALKTQIDKSSVDLRISSDIYYDYGKGLGGRVGKCHCRTPKKKQRRGVGVRRESERNENKNGNTLHLK